jgi:hypothetical protein
MSLRPLLAGILVVCFVAVCALQAIAPIDFGTAGFARCIVWSSAATAVVGFIGFRLRGRWSAILLGGVFLFEFAALATPLTHFAFWIHGPYIDGALARLDRMMGFDWPAMMSWFAARPALNMILWLVYVLSTFQILIVCVSLGLAGASAAIERLCLATVISTGLTIGFWAAFPSFGAVAVYGAPEHMKLIMDNAYTRGLLDLLAQGPGAVPCITTRGAVGFPSYHAVESVLACWYLREARWAFVAFLLFNVVAFVSMPVQGGHHLVDLFGGIAVAAISIAAVRLIASPSRRMQPAFA